MFVVDPIIGLTHLKVRIASKKNHQLREVVRLLNALGRHLFVADVKVITALDLFIFAERPQQRFGMAQRLAIETEMFYRAFLPTPSRPTLQSRREALIETVLRSVDIRVWKECDSTCIVRSSRFH